MRFEDDGARVVFDNLIEAESEFGVNKSAVETKVPAEEAVARNAVGTFAVRSLQDTYEKSQKFGARFKGVFGAAV